MSDANHKTSALSPIDQLIGGLDRSLRVLAGATQGVRAIPQADRQHEVVNGDGEDVLTVEEKRHAAALMRVNHVGEVCAQALYQAQKLTTPSAQLKQVFEHAAQEEEDHLHWTLNRIQALGGRPSLLNPLWYAGAFGIGLLAGRLGNAISLGFMAETEKQVERHLEDHLQRLPKADQASRAILEQMRLDEIQHGQTAVHAGGADLPAAAKLVMQAASTVMTRTAYFI